MGSFPQPPAFRFHVKRIAVIGAGPCGLAAVKYLLAQTALEHVAVFEQQPEVGGIWHYDERAPEILHVPQVSASMPPDIPLRSGAPGEPPFFPTPMYSVLHTNVPRELMSYTDVLIPADTTKIYPAREAVQQYLVDYAREVRHLIRFSTQVTDVRLQQQRGVSQDDDDDGDGTVIKDQWVVKSLALATGEVSSATFDAVVVASGHFCTYYIPDMAGISAFHAAHPGVISHSRSYRDAAAFAGKKVVIVGNSASGTDVAAQVSRVCRGRLLLSARTPTPPDLLAWTGAEEVPEIDEFLAAERAVRFRGGRVERAVDAVMFATGYLYSFPFLRPSLLQAAPLPVADGDGDDGRRVRGLYQHLIHIEHPTLAFVGLPRMTAPLPLAQSQAAAVAGAWANALPLPSREEMRRWEQDEEERARRDGNRNFHEWPSGAEGDYINAVYGQIARLAAPGKEPPRWGKRRLWERSLGMAPKLEFEKGGRKARSLEELGFVYRPPGDTDCRPAGGREKIGKEQSALEIKLRI